MVFWTNKNNTQSPVLEIVTGFWEIILVSMLCLCVSLVSSLHTVHSMLVMWGYFWHCVPFVWKAKSSLHISEARCSVGFVHSLMFRWFNGCWSVSVCCNSAVVWFLNNAYIVVVLEPRLQYKPAISVVLFSAEKWGKCFVCVDYWILSMTGIFKIASTHIIKTQQQWVSPTPHPHLLTMWWWLLNWQWGVHCLLVVVATVKRPVHRWINSAGVSLRLMGGCKAGWEQYF